MSKTTQTPEATIEDRSIRSEKARVALRIFLQRCAVRMGVESLVLADGRGESVVCTDETTDAMSAARHAAGLYHDGEPVPDSLDRKQQVWPVSLGVDVGVLAGPGRARADHRGDHRNLRRYRPHPVQAHLTAFMGGSWGRAGFRRRAGFAPRTGASAGCARST